VIDQFDNPRWPRSGYFMSTVFTSSLPALGSYTASRDYDAVVEGSKLLATLPSGSQARCGALSIASRMTTGWSRWGFSESDRLSGW
jgi:NTE family protein